MTGRVPPHNLEAEESLLGAMLLTRDAIFSSIDAHVDEAHFYKPAHGHIFTAVMALYDQGEPVDPVTVADELRRVELLDGLGGRQALLRLQASTPASANATHYARIVTELAQLRRLIAAGGDIAELGYDEVSEVRETVDRAEAIVFEVAERRDASSSATAAEVFRDTLDDLERPALDLTGVPSGFVDYDRLLLGLQAESLNVLAARPAMGKTAFALGTSVHVALSVRRPVMVFSMEMGSVELGKRILAQTARVNLRHIQQRRVGAAELEKCARAINGLASMPLIIDDNPHCTVLEMRAKARREKARRGDLALIVVDYIQLMQPSVVRGGRRDESKAEEVGEITRGLKLLARELECPVLALSQLNRQLEYRNDKRPMLADLRSSGSIEQDADVVTFLYRDDVYNPDSDQRGTAEVIVAKHRNGPTGTTRLSYIDYLTLFANMARDEV